MPNSDGKLPCDEFQGWLGTSIDALHRHAWTLRGNEPDADDLFQDTVLECLKSRNFLGIIKRSHKEATAFAFTTMNRLSIDAWRRLAQHPTKLLGEVQEAIAQQETGLFAAASSLDDLSTQADSVAHRVSDRTPELIAAAAAILIMPLSPDEQKYVQWVDSDRKKTEAAAYLGVCMKTYWNQLTRGAKSILARFLRLTSDDPVRFDTSSKYKTKRT